MGEGRGGEGRGTLGVGKPHCRHFRGSVLAVRGPRAVRGSREGELKGFERELDVWPGVGRCRRRGKESWLQFEVLKFGVRGLDTRRQGWESR